MLYGYSDDFDFNNQFLYDYVNKYKYRRLSKQEEIDYIKKAKLSFYDDVTDDEKAKYLEYYMEMFPKFKEKYEKTQDEKLLDLAIENSKYYRDKFLENNQRLVLRVISRYKNKCNFLSLMDLFDEGNIGMFIALKRFDIEKEVKFSTYAVFWIKQIINNARLKYDRMIRIPVQQDNNLKMLNRVERELYFSLERTPTVNELANYSGLPVKRVEMLKDYYYNKEMLQSLDMPFWGDDVETVGDFVQSNERDFTVQVENEVIVSECIDYLKSKLSPEHVEALLKRYGLEDGVDHSYNNVANQMGIPLKRVKKLDYDNMKVLRKKFKVNNGGK